MTTYIDVGVVRIGSYISRWPELKGRRGASAMITKAAASVELPDGVCRHAEAGEVDGVLHLQLDIPADRAEQHAEQVLLSLRRLLPAADLEAAWGEGDNYEDALVSGIRPSFVAGTQLRSFPNLAEMPFLARCESTGTDVAVASGADRPRLGQDALLRDGEAGKRNATAAAANERTALDREFWLMEQVGATQSAADFSELATLVPDGVKGNHLATISIDGDNIGAVFQTLPPADRPALSAKLKRATESALVDATKLVVEALGHPPVLPVMPHIVGGDDVIVSLPAVVAFDFVEGYLRTFEEGAGNGLSATAGIVISHATYPFDQNIKTSDGLMTKAKRFSPSESVFYWLDLTSDGPAPPKSRLPLSLDLFDRCRAPIDEIASTGKSMRHEMERLAAHPVQDVASAGLSVLFARHGVDPESELGKLHAQPSLMLDLLSIADWWLISAESEVAT